MPKILKPEVAKPIAEEVVATIRARHPQLNDAQIRAALNMAATLTVPFVKRVAPAKEEAVTEEVIQNPDP